MRVGIGYDVHPLKAGRALIIGGVRLEHPRGLDGHSDADVLTHAVIDALLGAAGLGDIGKLFPPGDARFKDASSLDLLVTAAETVRATGYTILNVDCSVIAQEPRLASHLHEMAQKLSVAMKVNLGHVNVKATSPEGLGGLGRGEGIAAQAVALID